jgi:hypothetical protein
MLPYILLLIYLVILLSSCGYAIRFGGKSEVYGATIMVVGSFLTPIVGYFFDSRWRSTEFGVLLVDIGVLSLFLALALRSDKYWPLWTTAFQVIGVVTHLARFVDPGIIPRAYSIAQGFWAYPMLVALVIGARGDHIAAKINAGRY